MIKVAVLDDYQNAFQQIIDVEKYKDKFAFKIFNNPFVDEKEAIVELEDFEAPKLDGKDVRIVWLQQHRNSASTDYF